MPTIKGLRRRGYTPNILNSFCKDIGATRNSNVVQYEKLNSWARSSLHEISPRVMVVLHPLKVILLSNHSESSLSIELTIPDYPFDITRGNHKLHMENMIYIDQQDFRIVDSDDYFGLAPGKIVGLKYAFRIRCDSYETNPLTGEPIAITCTVLNEDDQVRYYYRFLLNIILLLLLSFSKI